MQIQLYKLKCYVQQYEFNGIFSINCLRSFAKNYPNFASDHLISK